MTCRWRRKNQRCWNRYPAASGCRFLKRQRQRRRARVGGRKQKTKSLLSRDHENAVHLKCSAFSVFDTCQRLDISIHQRSLKCSYGSFTKNQSKRLTKYHTFFALPNTVCNKWHQNENKSFWTCFFHTLMF